MSLPSDEHRPWPVPSSPWVLFMRWRNLAFLHWPVPVEEMAPHVPEGLELQTFDGTGWLGITPFLMTDVRARFTPALPHVSSFPELNVRTYVSAGGKPGIWFMSLDAAQSLAVRVARWFFHLPYRSAEMGLDVVEDERVEFHSRRTEGRGVQFEGGWRPTGAVQPAEPGSLEHFLTERYCLYSARAGRLFRAEIHHRPWPLRSGAADVRVNTMTAPLSIDLDGPPLVHVADRLDVVGWLPEPLNAGPG